MKKNREHKDNILFIDASQNFGKATNQNYLRDEDVNAILDAVESREFKIRYSYVAPIKSTADSESVEEHGYNLNIPRYVDTFVEEPTVNISVVSSELKNFESLLVDTDEKIQEFCRELDISCP